jgi:hypothetical protein
VAEVIIARSMGQRRNMFLVPACTVRSSIRMWQTQTTTETNGPTEYFLTKRAWHVYSVEEWVGWVPWLMVSNNPKAFIALKQRFQVIRERRRSNGGNGGVCRWAHGEKNNRCDNDDDERERRELEKKRA